MTTTPITDASAASTGRLVTIDAKPAPIVIDTAQTAVVVVDMQNDFGAEGGMFHRAGIDISMIQGAVAPTAATLKAVRCGTGHPVPHRGGESHPDQRHVEHRYPGSAIPPPGRHGPLQASL